MTRRTVPRPPAAWLAAARAAPVHQRLGDVDTAARELVSAAIAELLRCDVIRTGRRSAISARLDAIVADWGRWSEHADRLELELAEADWPTEQAA